jgi:hypothetical protein
MRASDADRERVAQLLHKAAGEGRLDLQELDDRLAAVYASKTYGELAPITADLAIPGALSSPSVDRIGGIPGSSSSVAFMSGVNRKGHWVVPANHTTVAVMGGVDIDLTEARFAELETTITVCALWGGVEIVVPEDITVRVDGFGLLGAFENKTTGRGLPGGPVLRITGLAVMAGVEVKHPKRKKLTSDD